MALLIVDICKAGKTSSAGRSGSGGKDGFEVIEVATAPTALPMLEKTNGAVDPVFTDVDMPSDMNGVEVAESVHCRRPNIGIVITSEIITKPNVIPERGVFLPKPYLVTTPVQNPLRV